MRKNFATILGFLIAPLFAAIALVVIAWAKSGFGPLEMSELPSWVALYYWYTLGVTLIFALPTYFLLRRFNKITWWSATLVGMFIGEVMAIILHKYQNLLLVAIGGLSGLIFWLIWRQEHNPRKALW